MWVEQSEMRGLLIGDKDRKEKRIRSDRAVWATREDFGFDSE